MLQSWLLKKYKNTAVQTLLCLKRTWGEKWDTTHFHEKVIDVDDHLPFGWLSIDLEAQNCQNVINQVNNTTCVTVWMCVWMCSLQECELRWRRGPPQDERVWGTDWCAALCHPDSPGHQWDRQQGLTFPSSAFLLKYMHSAERLR